MSAVSRKIFIVSGSLSVLLRVYPPVRVRLENVCEDGAVRRRTGARARRRDDRHPREQESMTPSEPSVLRLLVFTPSADDGYVDNALRSLARSVAELPLCSIAVGRRHDQARERVIATTWPDVRTMIAALGPGSDQGVAGIEDLPVMADARVYVLPVAFSLAFDRTGPPSVLRVYRGRARPGELHEYTAEVREGTFADDSAAHGPLTLCL